MHFFFSFSGESHRAQGLSKPSICSDQRGGGCDGSAGPTRPRAKGSELEGGAGLHGQG